MTMDRMVFVGCEVVGIRLVDLGVMVLELDSSFWSCFCLELDGLEEWTSGVFNMVDITGGF